MLLEFQAKNNFVGRRKAKKREIVEDPSEEESRSVGYYERWGCGR